MPRKIFQTALLTTLLTTSVALAENPCPVEANVEALLGTWQLSQSGLDEAQKEQMKITDILKQITLIHAQVTLNAEAGGLLLVKIHELANLGMNGLGTFDLKYDPTDGRWKAWSKKILFNSFSNQDVPGVPFSSGTKWMQLLFTLDFSALHPIATISALSGFTRPRKDFESDPDQELWAPTEILPHVTSAPYQRVESQN